VRVRFGEEGHDRRRLGQPVAVTQRNAAVEVGVQERLGDHVAADERGPERREVGGRPARMGQEVGERGGVGEQQRHRVTLDRLQHRRRVGALRHDDGPAREEGRQDEHAEAAEARQRSEREGHVVRPDPARREHVDGVPREIGVGQQGALRAARRARGVAEDRQIAERDVGPLRGVGLRREQLRVDLVRVDRRTGKAHVLVAGVERQPDAGVAQDVIHLVGGPARQHRDPDAAERGRREQRLESERMVRSLVGDPITGSDAAPAQQAGEPLDPIRKLRVGAEQLPADQGRVARRARRPTADPGTEALVPGAPPRTIGHAA